MSEQAPANFITKDARRIAKATRRVEQMPGLKEEADYGSPVREALLSAARITAAAAINGGIRFKYTIRLGHMDMATNTAGGGAWVEDVAQDFFAFNEAEDMNVFTSGTGAIGTGNTSVAQSDGTIGSTVCKLRPLPVGGFVSVRPRGVDGGGVMSWTIVGMANSAQ